MDEEDKIRKNPVPRLAGRYLKWTAYGLLILLFSILQSTPRLLPTPWGASLLLMIPLTVCISMFAGPVGGAAAGVAAGLLWDLYADRLLGFSALLLLFIGCACGLLVRLLIRNNLLSALLLTSGALLFQGLADWFFNYLLLGLEDPLFVLVRLTLPDLGYTLVISPLVYGLVYLIAGLLRRRE